MSKIFSQLDRNGNSVDLSPLADLDSALELLHFSFRGLTRDADIYLESIGLGRVHHRILYILARRDRTTVGDLQAILGVTKQGLHRPLKKLTSERYVNADRDPNAGRFKLLELTKEGRRIESEASNRERAVVRAAFEGMADEHIDAWYQIMRHMSAKA